MPQYAVSLTVDPLGTGQATLLTAESIVDQVAVTFPSGCADLVRVALFERGQQFAPAPGSQTQWLSGDGATITWDDEYKMGTSPYELVLRVENDDDTYAHTITAQIVVSNVTQQLLLESMRFVFQQLSTSLLRLLTRQGG